MVGLAEGGPDDQLLRTVIRRAHRVESVSEQVQDDLLELPPIASDQWQVVGKLGPPDHALSLKFTQRQGDHLSRGLIEIDRFDRKVLLAKQRAQSLDELVRTVAVANRAPRGLACALDVGRIGGQHAQSDGSHS